MNYADFSMDLIHTLRDLLQIAPSDGSDDDNTVPIHIISPKRRVSISKVVFSASQAKNYHFNCVKMWFKFVSFHSGVLMLVFFSSL